MPLISRVGSRHAPVRLLYASLFALLAIGAITILYPVGLMMSRAVRSNADANTLSLWPTYLFDDWELFRKYIVEKDPVAELAVQYGHDDWKLPGDVDAEQLKALLSRATNKQLCAARDDWAHFLSICPEEFKVASFNWTRDLDYSVMGVRRQYQHWLERRFGGSIDAYNAATTDAADAFSEIAPPYHDPLSRRWIPPATPSFALWIEFLRQRQPCQIKVATLEQYLVGYLARHYFTLENINAHCGTRYGSLSQIEWDDLIEGRLRLAPAERERIIRQAPLLYVRIERSPDVGSAWDAHVRSESARFGGDARIGSARLTPTVPTDSALALAVWSRFVEVGCPLDRISFRSPLKIYREMLLETYGSIAAINEGQGQSYGSASDIRLPAPQVDYAAFRSNIASLRWSFLSENFAMVLDHLALRGRALWVTAMLVTLSVIGALTVNPLAAYALSRYRLPYTQGLLLFFLATMAFPASVTMIPGFLLLKDLSLLNTLWALVLPGLANGFSIFLLKGFFDSLPPELYESAMMDGATEPRMFWSITMPMCKPILAVIALGAFAASYGSFMFAFLTCQDPKWWTIMVFLYEFQQSYSPPLVMASLVVASVPTLAVFLVCQNIILRGIVVPSFR